MVSVASHVRNVLGWFKENVRAESKGVARRRTSSARSQLALSTRKSLYASNVRNFLAKQPKKVRLATASVNTFLESRMNDGRSWMSSLHMSARFLACCDFRLLMFSGQMPRRVRSRYRLGPLCRPIGRHLPSFPGRFDTRLIGLPLRPC